MTDPPEDVLRILLARGGFRPAAMWESVILQRIGGFYGDLWESCARHELRGPDGARTAWITRAACFSDFMHRIQHGCDPIADNEQEIHVALDGIKTPLEEELADVRAKLQRQIRAEFGAKSGADAGGSRQEQ